MLLCDSTFKYYPYTTNRFSVSSPNEPGRLLYITILNGMPVIFKILIERIILFT